MQVISRAHHGILNGKNLTGWRAEDRRRRADLGDTIKVMRKKTYAKNQPVVVLDPRGKSLLEKLAHGEGGGDLASSLEIAGGDKAQAPLENAATDYLRLPRPMHHRRDTLHPKSQSLILTQNLRLPRPTGHPLPFTHLQPHSFRFALGLWPQFCAIHAPVSCSSRAIISNGLRTCTITGTGRAHTTRSTLQTCCLSSDSVQANQRKRL